MKPRPDFARVGVQSKIVGSLVLLAALAYAAGWYGLKFGNYFLDRHVDFSKIHREEQGQEFEQALYYFQWSVPERLTWGVLANSQGLGLEEKLVEESYRCTQSVSMRFREIAQLEIQPGTTITVMLRSGACPSKSAAR